MADWYHLLSRTITYKELCEYFAEVENISFDDVLIFIDYFDGFTHEEKYEIYKKAYRRLRSQGRRLGKVISSGSSVVTLGEIMLYMVDVEKKSIGSIHEFLHIYDAMSKEQQDTYILMTYLRLASEELNGLSNGQCRSSNC